MYICNTYTRNPTFARKKWNILYIDIYKLLYKMVYNRRYPRNIQLSEKEYIHISKMYRILVHFPSLEISNKIAINFLFIKICLLTIYNKVSIMKLTGIK